MNQLKKMEIDRYVCPICGSTTYLTVNSMKCTNINCPCHEVSWSDYVDGYSLEQFEQDKIDAYNRKCEMKNHLSCLLIDGTLLDFNGLCTTVREFSSDSFCFIAKNFNTNAELNLEIIPKNQIKRIIFYNTDKDIQRVTSDSAFEEVE